MPSLEVGDKDLENVTQEKRLKAKRRQLVQASTPSSERGRHVCLSVQPKTSPSCLAGQSNPPRHCGEGEAWKWVLLTMLKQTKMHIPNAHFKIKMYIEEDSIHCHDITCEKSKDVFLGSGLLGYCLRTLRRGKAS